MSRNIPRGFDMCPPPPWGISLFFVCLSFSDVNRWMLLHFAFLWSSLFAAPSKAFFVMIQSDIPKNIIFDARPVDLVATVIICIHAPTNQRNRIYWRQWRQDATAGRCGSTYFLQPPITNSLPNLGLMSYCPICYQEWIWKIPFKWTGKIIIRQFVILHVYPVLSISQKFFP